MLMGIYIFGELWWYFCRYLLTMPFFWCYANCLSVFG